MPIELQTNIHLVPDPAHPRHLVNVQWVQDFFRGLQKAPVRLVSTIEQVGTYNTSDQTFTYTAQGPADIDDEDVDLGDRVLFTGQTTNGFENLIYECTHVGVAGTDSTILTVADDFNEDAKILTGTTVTVSEGDEHAGTTWRLITPPTIIFESTALEWEVYEAPRTTEVWAGDFDGDGTLTSWVLNHGLGVQDVVVQLRNRANQAVVMADIELTDVNNVTVNFVLPPPTGAGYRAVIIG